MGEVGCRFDYLQARTLQVPHIVGCGRARGIQWYQQKKFIGQSILKLLMRTLQSTMPSTQHEQTIVVVSISLKSVTASVSAAKLSKSHANTSFLSAVIQDFYRAKFSVNIV